MTTVEDRAKNLKEQLTQEFPLGKTEDPDGMVSVPRKQLSDVMWSRFNDERSLERIVAVVAPLHNDVCGGISVIGTSGHVGWEGCVKNRIDYLLEIEKEYRRLKLIEGEMERMQYRLESVLKGEDPDR